MCEVLPDSVQHAGCDALPSGQAEHPDPTDATQGLFWDGGAAPRPVALHEVLLRHIFVPIRLLQYSVSLEETDGAASVNLLNSFTIFVGPN